MKNTIILTPCNLINKNTIKFFTLSKSINFLTSHVLMTVNDELGVEIYSSLTSFFLSGKNYANNESFEYIIPLHHNTLTFTFSSNNEDAIDDIRWVAL